MTELEADMIAARGILSAEPKSPNTPVMLPPNLYEAARRMAIDDGTVEAFERRYKKLMPIPFTPRKGSFRHVWEFWKR